MQIAATSKNIAPNHVMITGGQTNNMSLKKISTTNKNVKEGVKNDGPIPNQIINQNPVNIYISFNKEKMGSKGLPKPVMVVEKNRPTSDNKSK